MVAPVILSVVAFIAGHPTQVACDSTLGGHAAPGMSGWTAYGGDTIYVIPQLCDEAGQPVGSDAFALALGTLIHEAAHAKGVRSEACAEMTADLGIYQVLRDFYNIPFFTDMSQKVGGQVLDITRLRPQAYQPETCWGGAYG